MKLRCYTPISMVMMLNMTLAPPARSADSQGIDLGEQKVLRTAASITAGVYRQDGMDGLSDVIASCYFSLPTKHGQEHLQACIGLDLAATYLDDGVAKVGGIAPDPRFTDREVLTRVSIAMRRAGMAADPDSVHRYLTARFEYLQRYLGEALAQPLAGPAVEQGHDQRP